MVNNPFLDLNKSKELHQSQGTDFGQLQQGSVNEVHPYETKLVRPLEPGDDHFTSISFLYNIRGLRVEVTLESLSKDSP